MWQHLLCLRSTQFAAILFLEAVQISVRDRLFTQNNFSWQIDLIDHFPSKRSWQAHHCSHSCQCSHTMPSTFICLLLNFKGALIWRMSLPNVCSTFSPPFPLLLCFLLLVSVHCIIHKFNVFMSFSFHVYWIPPFFLSLQYPTHFSQFSLQPGLHATKEDKVVSIFFCVLCVMWL